MKSGQAGDGKGNGDGNKSGLLEACRELVNGCVRYTQMNRALWMSIGMTRLCMVLI